MVDVAGLLAAHGYPALSLAYFGEPGLPSELVRVPLEYFARAVRLLDGVPGVDPTHVVVMGDSRGGEAALLLAATFPRLIHGAIGLVPSASVYPAPAANLRAWTLHGTAVPLEPIPVERITGPVLTVGAGDDQVWSSAESVHQIEQRLARHNFRFKHEGLVYPRAGHANRRRAALSPAINRGKRIRRHSARRHRCHGRPVAPYPELLRGTAEQLIGASGPLLQHHSIRLPPAAVGERRLGAFLKRHGYAGATRRGAA